MSEAVKVSYKGRNLRRGFVGRIVAKLPAKLRAPMLYHAAEFMVSKWKPYPAYKWVTRRAAYGGNGFFSERQRKFVMASLRAGRNLKTGSPMEPGYPHRTGNAQRAWTIQGKGVNISIVNTAPHAVYLFDPKLQARQPRLVGWETTKEMADKNMGEMAADLFEFARQEIPKEIEKILFEG